MMKVPIQLGFASLNKTFYLSPHENIFTIALITIHYLYDIFHLSPNENICTIARMESIHYLFYLT